MVARIRDSERPAQPFLSGGELLPLLHGEVGKSARWRAQLRRGIPLPHGWTDSYLLGQAGRTQGQIFQMTRHFNNRQSARSCAFFYILHKNYLIPIAYGSSQLSPAGVVPLYDNGGIV